MLASGKLVHLVTARKLLFIILLISGLDPGPSHPNSS